MLFTNRELEGIESGSITVCFRRWRSPRVRIGTQLRTSIGLVEVTDLTAVEVSEVGNEDARAAGFVDADAFNDWIDDRAGVMYRIGVRPAGPDPRIALRNDDELSAGDVDGIAADLQRMDTRADLPWTMTYLRLIQNHPETVSTELAEEIGENRKRFKQKVRRLKELGLTESLKVGYRLSPRGAAFLEATDAEDG